MVYMHLISSLRVNYSFMKCVPVDSLLLHNKQDNSHLTVLSRAILSVHNGDYNALILTISGRS